MGMKKPLQAVTLILLLAVILAPAPAGEERPPEPVKDGDLQKWVDQRVRQWQPTAEEKRFDEIGWCHSIMAAERLAREHKRPLFLFTHDGRMAVGRC